MKRLMTVLALAALFLVPVAANAQFTDLSLWTKVRSGQTVEIPWYVHGSKGGLFTEVRYNFDWKGSGTLFVGKAFHAGGFTVTPALGAIAGSDYNALSAEVNTSYSAGKWSVFLLDQNSWGKGKSTDFTYHFVDILHRSGKGAQIGFDAQLYREPHGKSQVDFGPVLKLTQEHALFSSYVKFWAAATNTGAPKWFVGFGLSS